MTHGPRAQVPQPEPYTLAVPERDLDDLRARLRNTRWARDAGNDEWHYGVERTWLQDLVGYWAEEFDCHRAAHRSGRTRGDARDAFDVVVPSLPGFGFSVPLEGTGFGARRIADLWHTLMHDVLGYERFAVGGGDWGSTISGEVAHGYPESVVRAWLTLPNIPGVALWEIGEADFDPDEK